MSYATAKTLDPDVIPVIDISPLRDGTDPKSVAAALHRASQGLGFIYITGHGIPEATIAAARAAAYGFFRSDEALKAQVAVASSHRGWLRPGGAQMQDDAKADLKESFIWGWEPATDETPDDHPLRGRNRWPEFVPNIAAQSMAYFEAAHGVAHHLMRAFAMGLDLPEDFFLRSSDRPLSRASYVYYPAQPA
ncbi:MAG: 2-oxoglutarate and iron-dependent oxygenase domain-containing protein, partial [Pseudomonadota bacterium]